MSDDPDQIREQIQVTRGTLSSDVNTLADTVRPGNVARRQVDKVRGVAVSTKERIMGTASDLGSSASDLGSRASDLGSVRAQTEGNPLAAGLIAFGAGWLVASLIPSSGPEQRAATKARENASVLTEPLGEAAGQVGSNLRGRAQEAADAVKATAADAAASVRSEGVSAVQDVKDVKDQGTDARPAMPDTRS
jgi:hypothetical protein